MGYRVAYQRGFGWRALSTAIGAILAFFLSIPRAQADAEAVDGVTLACPDLAEATAAELEARARATLLTSELSATVAISCTGDLVVVQVDAGGNSVTLKLRVAVAKLREEVLKALDRALADLGARVTTEIPTSAPGPTPNSTTESGGARFEPEAAETPAPARTEQPASALPPRAREMEVGAGFIGEKWGNKPALGAGLRAGVRFDSTWSCGIRAGAMGPLGFGEATVIEAHAVLEAAVIARGLAGLRFGLGVGPSLLFASPAAEFVAPRATLKSALRIEAQIGRPFRWHWAELTPWLGARTFTAERGIRVTDQARLVVGSVEPQLGLALSLIH